MKLLGQHDGHTLRDANVRIDGSGDREFRRALTAYMRRELGPERIRDLRMSDSKRDPLIQLADMCVSAPSRDRTEVSLEITRTVGATCSRHGSTTSGHLDDPEKSPARGGASEICDPAL